MTKPQSAAEAITSIIFDPFTEKLGVFQILKGEKPAPARHRTLAEARTALKACGVDDTIVDYFVRGLSDLQFETVARLEKEVPGFSRRTSVKWDDEDSYLGIGFKHESVTDIAKQRPDLVAGMRRDFLTHVSAILDRTARTSLPADKIDRAAHLAYA